jgi:hypothetical protein
MDRACNTHKRDNKYRVCWKSIKGKNIEDTGIDGRIVLKGIYKTKGGGYGVTIWLRVVHSCVHSTNPWIP